MEHDDAVSSGSRSVSEQTLPARRPYEPGMKALMLRYLLNDFAAATTKKPGGCSRGTRQDKSRTPRAEGRTRYWKIGRILVCIGEGKHSAKSYFCSLTGIRTPSTSASHSPPPPSTSAATTLRYSAMLSKFILNPPHAIKTTVFLGPSCFTTLWNILGWYAGDKAAEQASSTSILWSSVHACLSIHLPLRVHLPANCTADCMLTSS